MKKAIKVAAAVKLLHSILMNMLLVHSYNNNNNETLTAPSTT